MPSLWRKSMLYLGLGPDEDYDHMPHEGGRDDVQDIESESTVEVVAPVSESRGPNLAQHPLGSSVSTSSMSTGIPTQPLAASMKTVKVRPAGTGEGIVSVTPLDKRPIIGSVRTIPVSSSKPHIVSPRSFNDAQQVADRFKADQPIIVNLQAVDRELSRRLIDFTSGLCYALDGNMEKVADNVYLLSPSNVQVPEEERRRLQERGLHS